MDYERELIPLARLRLNNENDRHGPLTSEHECLHWLLTNHRDHMINLAKDIAERGLSPIDGILVLPSDENVPGDYDVWEGNRRVAALKLLDDPNRCHDSKVRRRFTEIRGQAKIGIPQEVECTVAPSIEEAERLIELRHQGPQEGIGTLPWDPKQKNRHQQRLGKRGRYAFSQQVLDAITDKLDDELKKKLQSKGFPISTLDRILNNTHAREFLGLSTEGGAPQRILQEQETLKGLTKILWDIAKGMPVGKVYSSERIREYLGTFDKKDIPDPKKTMSEPVPLTTHDDARTKIRARSRPLAHDRKRLIPSGVSYSIQDHRVNAIYYELRRLDVDTFKNAVAVLFRVFLELSVDLYLNSHGITYHASETLRDKARKALTDMTTNGWLDKNGRKGIDSTIKGQHTPHGIDTFNAYVHNGRFQPKPSDLNTEWDNLQPFFDALFSHLT